MTTYFPGILSNGALVPGLAAGTVRTTLGLGTADSPTFSRIFLGGASAIYGNDSGTNTDIGHNVYADDGFRSREAGSVVLLQLQEPGNQYAALYTGLGTAPDTLVTFNSPSSRWAVNSFAIGGSGPWLFGSIANLVQIAGITSAFPAIKRNGTAINFRLADDSADAPITAAGGTFSGKITTGPAAGLELGNGVTVGSNHPYIRLKTGWGDVNIMHWGGGLTFSGAGLTVVGTTNIGVNGYYGLTGAGSPTETADVRLYRGGPGILSQRNGTNAQTLEVYKTYTSPTSNERLALDTTAAGFLDIVAARGSAGGAANGIRIGGKVDGGSFVPWLSFATTGAATFGNVSITNNLTVGNNLTANSFLQSSTNAGVFFSPNTRLQAASSQPIIQGSFNNDTIVSPARNDVNYLGDVVIQQGGSERLRISEVSSTFSGQLNLRASTTAADTAPIKLPTGVLMTTPEAGAIEYDGTNLYFTDSGGTRRTLAVV